MLTIPGPGISKGPEFRSPEVLDPPGARVAGDKVGRGGSQLRVDGGAQCCKLPSPLMFKPEESSRIVCHAPLWCKWKSEAQRGHSTQPK